MKIIKNILEIPKNEKLGLTIGNFDGFHKGHQFLLKSLSTKCNQKKQSFLVITFNPHPKVILSDLNERFLLTSYKNKIELIRDNGVDYCLELNFNRDFSTQTPADFLDKEILIHPGVQSIYLGHDFVFGSDKQGDFKFTEKYCKNKNVEVEKLPKYEEFKVSSSLIRGFLNAGNIKEVTRLLGRNHFVEGLVVKGEGRGKKIGFPTANINFSKEIMIPSNGVYITTTKIKDLNFQSVTNIGLNPTFNDKGNINVETHILDFDNDIYGESITVFFEKKIRDERKFPSVNDLISQISKDVQMTKEYFSK